MQAIVLFLSDPYNVAGILLFTYIYFMVCKRMLHFRAFNVWNIKTNPNAWWRFDRSSIKYAYKVGRRHVPKKIEDFCIMVNRVMYRREILVKLYGEDGNDLHMPTVWMKKSDLTRKERMTKTLKCVPVCSPDKHGFAFITENHAYVSAVETLAGSSRAGGKTCEYVSLYHYEMIQMPQELFMKDEVVKARVERLKEDHAFIVRHYKRAALSYRLAYGSCLPLKYFLPHYQYSPISHDMAII